MKNVLLVIGVLIAALAGTYFFYLKSDDKAPFASELPLALASGFALSKLADMSRLWVTFAEVTDALGPRAVRRAKDCS